MINAKRNLSKITQKEEKSEAVNIQDNPGSNNTKILKRNKISFIKLITALCIFLVITFCIYKLSVYVYVSIFSQKSEELEVKENVSKLIMTRGETSKIYKVQDPLPLIQKNEFYKDVISGDFVLVFENLQKVIIYRKSENIIVNYSSTLGI